MTIEQCSCCLHENAQARYFWCLSAHRYTTLNDARLDRAMMNNKRTTVAQLFSLPINLVSIVGWVLCGVVGCSRRRSSPILS